MDENTLFGKVRTALRIKTADEGINNEIEDCIAAAKRELQEVGVINVQDSDALIIKACVLYAKAEFDFSGKGDAFRNSFVQLKCALSMAADYNESVGDTDA